MQRLPVYILAGGRSSRFGSDKARAKVGDGTLIEHVAGLLAGHASSVTAVAQTAGKYDDLGLRTIGDVTPGRGPLGGLATALGDLKTRAGDGQDDQWLLMCSCDALVIEPHWLTKLLDATACSEHGVLAAAFRGDYWQPMPGVYAIGALSCVVTLAASEHRSMQRLLGMLNAMALSLPDDWPERWQANRPQDLPS